MLVGDLISLCGYKRREPAQCCCAVIAGELGCLSMITYILCPPPAALIISLSDFHHPLPMFSLTPCIYNMLEQPLECKDPAEALSKDTQLHAGLCYTQYTHRCGALRHDKRRFSNQKSKDYTCSWLVGPQKDVVIVTPSKCHLETVFKMSAR